MNKWLKQFAFCMVLLSISLSSAAEQDRSRGKQVSERDAAQIVRSQKGGKVLDVKRRNGDDYRVKTLDRGKVRVYGVDGRTGEIRE